jgi:hypothetical protein
VRRQQAAVRKGGVVHDEHRRVARQHARNAAAGQEQGGARLRRGREGEQPRKPARGAGRLAGWLAGWRAGDVARAAASAQAAGCAAAVLAAPASGPVTWMHESQLRIAVSRGMPNSTADSMKAPGVT